MAKTETKENDAAEKLVDVTLLKDHEHNGEKNKASSAIKVNEADLGWLRAQHVIK